MTTKGIVEEGTPQTDGAVPDFFTALFEAMNKAIEADVQVTLKEYLNVRKGRGI